MTADRLGRPRCVCGGTYADHSIKWTRCYHAADCTCTALTVAAAYPPARLREHYDPGPGGVRRSIYGDGEDGP